MRISIDSSESLEDVIRVVGALYGVTLSAATPEAAGHITHDTSGSRSRARRASGTTTPKKAPPKRRAGNSRQRVSNAAVRSWARQNGYTISDRGRIPATVVEAYHQRN